MGHEYVELRNTAAAVQCYRKAVEVGVYSIKGFITTTPKYSFLAAVTSLVYPLAFPYPTLL